MNNLTSGGNAVSEQMLISSILRDANLTTAMARGIGPEVFHHYQKQYQWIEDYFRRHGNTPSVNAFKNKWSASDTPMMDQIQVMQANDTAHFSDQVLQQHTRMLTSQYMLEGFSRLKDKDIDPTEVLDYLWQGIMTTKKSIGQIDDGDIFEDNLDIMTELELRRKRFEESGYAGVPSGFPTFDARTGGFQPGEFHMFCARMGVGKSWLLQKMAASAAQAGFIVQFDALEQTRAQAATRIFSMFNKQDAQNDFIARNLMQGHGYDPEEFSRYVVDLRRKVKGRLHVSDGTKGKTTVSTVAAQIERNKPDVVFIDYFGLMGMSSRDYMGMGETAAELTQLSLQYEIPIVVAAQLNRSGTSDEASLETIAGSDEMARYATTISFIRRPSESVFDVKCEKSRNVGGDFRFYSKFAPERAVFKEISAELAQELIEIDRAKYDMEDDAS